MINFSFEEVKFTGQENISKKEPKNDKMLK